MNSPRTQEMDKLRRIQSQVQAVAHKIHERLPHQRASMAALVCAWRWRLRTLHARHADAYTAELVETTTKRLRMEVGTFEYATKEQGELLTRYLCELDNILSHGNTEIKDARKALVLEIQQLLEEADAVKTAAAKLKAFALNVVENLPQPTPTPASEDVGMDEEPAQEEEVAATSTAMESEEEQTPLRPVFEEEEEAEEDADVDEESDDEDTEVADDDNEDDEEETSAMEDEPAAQPQTDAVEEEEDAMASLPEWRPYYQIRKHPDGVYLVANLHGVDPRYLRVESIPREGVIRIAGVKFPTQKDMLLSRLSGAPTYGRFEIVERFPVGVLALDHASQQLLHDGTLQVRLPYAVSQRPRVVRRVSPFMMPGLAVW